MHNSSRRRMAIFFIVAAIVSCTLTSMAQETVVQNDSLVEGSGGLIQAGFDPGESAAVWLTSPCNGNIVAVQVFWRSLTGTAAPSVEDSIEIFETGTFPTPGLSLEIIEGPVMTDSVFNEFRFLNEEQTIPLIVPVTSGQEFVVSFKFFEDPNPSAGPSVVNDTSGCQAGKNAIDAAGFGWVSSCLLGVSGDWVIRAVVNCEAVAGGPGSIPNGGDTAGEPMRVDKVDATHVSLTWSDSCSPTDDNYGIFQGFLGLWYSHFAERCGTGGATTATVATDQFDRYYLVVPYDATDEGSYGRDGNGDERPAGGGACRGNQIVTCPSPP
jgi:hypothetical protein